MLGRAGGREPVWGRPVRGLLTLPAARQHGNRPSNNIDPRTAQDLMPNEIATPFTSGFSGFSQLGLRPGGSQEAMPPLGSNEWAASNPRQQAVHQMQQQAVQKAAEQAAQRRRVRALPTAMPMARCTASAMVFWRTGLEGRAETGTQFSRRESEVGAGRSASYESFPGAMC